MIGRTFSAILMFAILGSSALACQFEPGDDCSGMILEGVDFYQLLAEDQGKWALNGINFSGAHLKGASFRYMELAGVNFEYADLREANLSNANLKGANLNQSNLTEASFLNANLEGAHLRLAKIAGAFFLGANLKDANLSGASELTEVRGGLTVHSPAHFEGATFK